MDLRAALIDFDGTLVTRDFLDVLCGLVGKQEQSEALNQGFYRGETGGVDSLVQRLNLVQGLALVTVHRKLSEDTYLRQGTQESGSKGRR